MKQHITPKQLNELSEKGKERLRKWWKPKRGDWFYTHNAGKVALITKGMKTKSNRFFLNRKDRLSPLLSIGQMIEFLDDRDEWSMEKIFTWSIDLDRDDGIKDVYDLVELVDSLWEACKKVLES